MKRLIGLLVLLSPALALAEEPQVSPILYLNRCTGGCMIHGAEVDDARAMVSSIPPSGDHIVEEFRNYQNQTGAAADEEWGMIMQCMRELYSPYNIQVTDVLPPGGLSHNQGIIAGRPSNVMLSGVGGVAPGSLGCDPQDNVISFTFSNIYGAPTQQQRVWEICSVAGQETAHAYGLDHSYEFADGSSACTDPMTYRTDCGGQKFFRNQNARCGEGSARPCQCGGFQNSHLRILAIFGPGTPITRPPTVSLSSPTDGATINNGATAVATAAAQRGIARLELWLNNYKWLTVKGAPFGPSGQLESSYPLTLPANVPDGVIELVVKAFDDIDVQTDTQPITVTKGAPCTSAATCAKGQKCDAGKCYWDTPTGELGETCEYPQFCVSGDCLQTSEGSFCTEACVVGVADSCPMGYTCIGNAGGTGSCVAEDVENPPCCSVGGDPRAAFLMGAGVLGLVLRRRRRVSVRSASR